MDRLKRSGKGFTLIELVIATVLFAVVLIAASNLLVSFGNFSSNLVKNEASLMGTALGAFEQITGKIEVANQVTIPRVDGAVNSTDSIDIRVSPEGLGATLSHSGDTTYTFWYDNKQLKSTFKVGSGTVSNPIVIAEDVESLSFVRKPSPNQNHITVTLDAHTHSGSDTVETNKSKEHLVTTAIMRSRSAT